MTHGKLLFGLLMAILLPASAVARPETSGPSGPRWALSLAREDGVDMAELCQVVEEPGRSALEKQLVKLALAELKQLQARQAKTLDEQLALYDEAKKLMQDVVQTWPDQSTPEYYDAVFKLSDLLQERGEVAMRVAVERKVPGEKADQIRAEAESDYEWVETELEKIKISLGNPNRATDRAKWRTRTGAWYRLLLVRSNKALTFKEDSSRRVLTLNDVATGLEDYILENETDDDEARLGAIYGYLLLGQVRAALKEPTEALDNITSVLDQFQWKMPGDPNYQLHPVYQALVERTYYQLLNYLNELHRYDDTLRYGKEMEERFSRMKLAYGELGRAARLQLAEAMLGLGDMSGALGIAAEVIENAGGEASGALASRLVSEVIAATPDKSQFAPNSIRPAAKGAYSQGSSDPEKYKESIGYFRILLDVLPQVRDDETRKYFEADAWYYMGRAYYFTGRRLESALALEQGVKRCRGVEKDNLSSELARMWQLVLRELSRETKSEEIGKLYDACQRWLIEHP